LEIEYSVDETKGDNFTITLQSPRHVTRVSHWRSATMNIQMDKRKKQSCSLP